MRKTFPKDEKGKLKEANRRLRAERRKLLKRIKFLEDELIHIKKPIRERKNQTPLTDSEFRKEFMRKFKESLKNDRST